MGKIIVIISIFSVLSCVTNKTKLDDKIIHSIKDEKTSEVNSVNQDSVILITCNNIKQELKIMNIDWVHFNVELRNCLLKNGFNGDHNSNRQISNIIKWCGNLSVFGIGPKFRGPETFEALLEIFDDHSFTRDFDGNIVYNTNFTSFGLRYIFDSIESIENEDPSTYMNNAIKLTQDQIIKTIPDTEVFDPNLIVSYSKSYYKELVNLWRTGKIKLKDYGQL